jgi:23S rRNA pseudouridine1911/1915/1917 synthase
MKVEIQPSLDGERVDRVVAALTDISRSVVATMIAGGNVSIDGQLVKTRSLKVGAGQSLDIELPELASDVAVANSQIAFDAVYADEHLAVVNKPAGLVVHAGAGHETDTLVNGLLARFPQLAQNLPGDPQRPGIVHRLDGGTSGLLIVALTVEAYDALVIMMKERAIDRRYLALVWGDMKSDVGTIDAPIGRSDRNRTNMAVAADGRDAVTHYQVLSRSSDPDVSLIEAKLETGRTHQIRVHFAAIGHAVVGDARYRGARPQLPMERPFLHAQHLDFAHPISGEPMHFEAPVPDDLADVLQRLGLDARQAIVADR